MKYSDLPSIPVMAAPFAYGGTKNTIPDTNDQTTSTVASMQWGFPPRTSQPTTSGGVPPSRADFNAMAYLATTNPFLWSVGILAATFNPSIAAKIGGYPNGARLYGIDADGNGFIVRSTKDDNTDNFVTTPSFIGTSWVYDMVTPAWVIANFLGINAITRWTSAWTAVTPGSSLSFTPTVSLAAPETLLITLLVRNDSNGKIYMSEYGRRWSISSEPPVGCALYIDSGAIKFDALGEMRIADAAAASWSGHSVKICITKLP